MTYLALYRKWRPQTFAELAGQEHVARTLINAIGQQRLAHAYLFCGPRGTGKTTSARLLARALNCKQGPTPSPCGACASCRDIAAGSALDVIEIDAASNRGVNEMRDLLGRVHHAAVGGGHRIYIIDEVHMLTAEAFNTLLKTLEEPPPNLIFILATTEANKVLPTIVSRCQRLDFRRIPTGTMLQHLGKIAEAEGIRITPASLQAIARRAEGGLRDAISLLDQVSSLGLEGGEVSAELVLQLLGMVHTDALLGIAEAVAARQVPEALGRVRALLEGGYDYASILRELLEHFRNLLMVRLAPEAALADVPAEERPRLAEQSERFAPEELFVLMEVLRETEVILKGTTQPQIWLETGIMRLCQRQGTELAGRVAELERQLRALAAGGPRPAEPVLPPAEVRAAPLPEPLPEPEPRPVPLLIAEPPAPVAQPVPPPEPVQPPKTRGVIPFLAPLQSAPRAAPPPPPVREPDPVPEPQPEPPAPAPQQVSAAPEPATAGSDRWAAVLEELREQQPLLYGLVGDGRLVSADAAGRLLLLSLPGQFLKDQLEKNARRMKSLQEAVTRAFGAEYALRFEIHAAEPNDDGPAERPEPPGNGHGSSRPAAPVAPSPAGRDDAPPAQSFPAPRPRGGSFAEEIADVARGRVVDFPWPGD